MIVAIDGPAASGKSTVARAVAEALRVRYVDTGAMYRAIAWAVLRDGVDPADPAGVAAVAERVYLVLDQPPERPWASPRIVIDGEDVTAAVRTPPVNAAVSPVAAVPAVRRRMVAMQRELVGDGAAVVEGRDIGTVVFPQAEVKVFLTADPDERIRRRLADLAAAGVAQPDDAHGRVLDRDRIDSSRTDSPLAVAEDAHVIDTTALGAAGVAEAVLSLVRAGGA